MVGHPQAALIAQQQLAARASTPAGQQIRVGAGNAAAVAAAAAAVAAAADARRLAGKKRKAMDKPAAEKVHWLHPQQLSNLKAVAKLPSRVSLQRAPAWLVACAVESIRAVWRLQTTRSFARSESTGRVSVYQQKQLPGTLAGCADMPSPCSPVHLSCQALHLVPESPLFNSLVMQEHYVDDLIKRQRLELQAAVNPLECPVHKRLRVYVYNTHSHQQGPAAAGNGSSSSSDEPPQWTLVIWGRLENPDPPAAPKALSADVLGAGSSAAAEAAAGAPATSSAATPTAAAGGEAAAAPPFNVTALPPQPAQHGSQHKQPFTSFFKRVEVHLDPDQYPADTDGITWEKLLHR
jgi:hypothetical protein